MNLVIHDLNENEWEMIRRDYPDCTVISDSGTIRPCLGCFCCWHKTPGQCIQKDGYENMGQLIHQSAEVTVISRYTYGGFSGFVKNVFDRSLGYVLPQFEIVKGETHHKKRYDEDRPFTFVFYGCRLTDAEKQSARRYVQAVCTNIRGHVKDVIFRENGEGPVSKVRTRQSPAEKAVLINGSMRYENGNSAKLMRQLSGLLKKESEAFALQKPGSKEDLLHALEGSSDWVFCVPLYVDGLPSQVIRFMEQMRSENRGGSRRVYVLANMGLYESSQLQNLFETMRQWCTDMGFSFGGGLGLSAGELIGGLMEQLPFGFWPSNHAARGMEQLACAIDRGEIIHDIYAEPWLFPRAIYITIANVNWNRLAARNGIRPEDLYRKL